jgi:hypothetical protein
MSADHAFISSHLRLQMFFAVDSHGFCHVNYITESSSFVDVGHFHFVVYQDVLE